MRDGRNGLVHAQIARQVNADGGGRSSSSACGATLRLSTAGSEPPTSSYTPVFNGGLPTSSSTSRSSTMRYRTGGPGGRRGPRNPSRPGSRRPPPLPGGAPEGAALWIAAGPATLGHEFRQADPSPRFRPGPTSPAREKPPGRDRRDRSVTRCWPRRRQPGGQGFLRSAWSRSNRSTPASGGRSSKRPASTRAEWVRPWRARVLMFVARHFGPSLVVPTSPSAKHRTRRCTTTSRGPRRMPGDERSQRGSSASCRGPAAWRAVRSPGSRADTAAAAATSSGRRFSRHDGLVSNLSISMGVAGAATGGDRPAATPS